MPGNERRNQGPGRRSSDRGVPGVSAWTRILILAVTLAIAVYVLMVSRETARPQREAQALRTQSLQQDARLLAAALDGRIMAARAALALGAETLAATPGRPLDAPPPDWLARFPTLQVQPPLTLDVRRFGRDFTVRAGWAILPPAPP